MRTKAGRHGTAILFCGALVAALLATHLHEEELVAVGHALLARSGAGRLYLILFGLAAISSTILPLPVWVYVFTAVALGLDYLTASLVVALGSSLGSVSSYALGRYVRGRNPAALRVSDATLARWRDRSRPYVGAALFVGTVSPLPMDVLYLVCGALRFPAAAFLCLVTAARIVRYVAMGYLFSAVR